jgi:hypothetical protein
MDELERGGDEARRISELRERYERARHLRGHIDALGEVDADAQAPDEAFEFPRWQGS